MGSIRTHYADKNPNVSGRFRNPRRSGRQILAPQLTGGAHPRPLKMAQNRMWKGEGTGAKVATEYLRTATAARSNPLGAAVYAQQLP